MRKPVYDTRSWWEKLLGIYPSTPNTSSVPINNSTPASTSQYRGQRFEFETVLSRNNATMLKQLQEMNKYRGIIESVASRYQFQPALICGIGSRESHWGLALTPPGPSGRGDFSKRTPRGNRRGREPNDGPGYGRGLMQIDYDWHEFARTGNWQSPQENITYACDLLNKSRNYFKQRLDLSDQQLIHATVSSYNAGMSNVMKAIQNGQDFDYPTTGRDYARDVFNRSGWFQLHGWR